MNLLNSIWRDLIHAARSLAKARAFTFVCVVTLGVGMAPIIAIQYGSRMFTMPPRSVNIEAPTNLVELVTESVGQHSATSAWSYPDFIDLRRAQTSVSVVGWAVGEADVTPAAGPESPASVGPKTKAQTMFVSPGYFKTIGVALARGPGFSSIEETADPAVILGYAFWQKRLAADPDIIGKTLTLNGVPHVVVGIAPDQFGGHLAFQETELFLPIERHPVLAADKQARFDRTQTWVRIHGRLSPGVTIAQASAAVSAITAQLASEYPSSNEFRAGVVAPYHALGSLENVETSILMVVWQVLTAIPLLVVCLNVSGMVQVRSAMRERELSIRQAIGASRRRLMQHLLAEAVLLAGVGGTLASIVLFNIPPLVSWWIDEPMPAQLQAALNVDASMIAICIGLCLATSLVFGFLPALRFSRPVIMTVLKDEAGGGGVRAGRIHRITAALQVAITVPLLILSAMSLERVRATTSADFGFASDLLYAAPLKIDAAASEAAGSQLRQVRDNLARASGVAAVTIADGLPLDYRYRLARVALQPDPTVAPKVVLAHVTRVGDSYLDTMGIALLRGRGFTIDDGAGAGLVTVVSKTLADQLFPGADALGQRLSFDASGDQNNTQTLTVVGVTADFPTAQVTTDRAQLLLPLAQHADVRRNSVQVSDDRDGQAHLLLIARSAAGEAPQKLTAALENAIRDVDPDFDAARIVTGVWLRENSLADFLNTAAFGGISGGVTLLLAALGIYGVVGLMVTTRTREIAVRVTLGASRARVMGMILFDVVKLVAPGVTLGVLVTFAIVRLEGGIVVSTIEPLAYAAGGAVAVLSAILASLAPARRAASVEPMVAMRSA